MLEKTYLPADVEARIYAGWESSGAFKAGNPVRKNGKPYTIVIPPPNVTGSLHMGHALNNTLQDILCRFERMRGRDVLWQPGTDHAGIATQLVVERQMMERQEAHRREIGREAFVDKVWKWRHESGGTIINQLKRLGASCDWERERFTMGKDGSASDQMVRAVLKVFVELYRKGLIYKDKRLVNWDPEFQSAISDLEVEQAEHRGNFKWSESDKDKEGAPVPFDGAKLGKALAKDANGHMYYFRYPLAGMTFDPANPKTFIVVATTRPETMLGDTCVAVHPDHPKYGKWIGKKLVLPLTGREIPIIGDDYADPEKGTGAVKITPAHDFNDFEVGKRHASELVAPINIFDATAKLNDAVPEAYRGLDRFIARVRVTADLAADGHLEKIEPHTHQVPHAQRGNAVVEPWLTDQWYVDAKTLAKDAIAAVEDGRTKFVPENWSKTYFEWMRNIEPWCISRQLWWGHQIPAWYGPDGQVFVAFDEAEAQAQAERHYSEHPSPLWGEGGRRPDEGATQGKGKRLSSAAVAAGTPPHPPSGHPLPGGERGTGLTRDPDVLDTWFSSALWPFSTLGWPEATPELARYYPTDVLVTGFDIIFFWVARMMMMGLEFQKVTPFHTVYMHALVRDEKGQKMSKSKGNVIDPLELIDEYGADALRFTLARMAAQGRDIKLAKNSVEGSRNFATKLWNAARFAEMNECKRTAGFDPTAAKETINRWIGGEVVRTGAAVTAALEAYKFNEAAGAAYQFVWGTFCDWYLELAKPIFAGTDEAAKAETRAMTAWVFDEILKLLHPFMPFLTEELWRVTGEEGPKRQAALILTDWSNLKGFDDAKAGAEIGWLMRLVDDIRSARSELNVAAGAQVPLVIVGADGPTRARVDHHDGTLKRLARLSAIEFGTDVPKGSVQIISDGVTHALPLAGLVDVAAERSRLGKEADKARAEIAKIDGKFANEAFMAKAPAEVIEENTERKAAFTTQIDKLAAALSRLDQIE